jgi:hypothetical protein
MLSLTLIESYQASFVHVDEVTEDVAAQEEAVFVSLA